MGNINQEIGGTTVNPHLLAFEFVNVIDAADTMNIIGGNVGTAYRMPRAGSIVAISAQHSADLTGGVITYNPTIGGSADTSLAAVTEDTVQGHQAVINARNIPFAAGALIGMAYTKTGTIAPTTTDVIGLLEVVFEDEDF